MPADYAEYADFSLIFIIFEGLSTKNQRILRSQRLEKKTVIKFTAI
jgi:hypothetical protein